MSTGAKAKERKVKFNDKNEEFSNSDEFSEAEAEEEEETIEDRQFNKFQFLELDDNLEEESKISDDGDNKDCEQSDDKADKSTKSNNISTKQRKKRNKNRRKNKSNKELTKIDQNLANLSAVDNDGGKNIVDEKTNLTDANCPYSLLKLDMRNLIPDNELKRMFGKSVLKEENKTRDLKHKHLHLHLNGPQRSRFVSSTYHDLKMIPINHGPKMDLDNYFNSGETTGGKLSEQPIYFKFVHEKSYQVVHLNFLEFAQRGFSEGIVHNLQHYPTHIESLIQLSDIIRMSEDYKAASELIERALFIFERGFHPKFNISQANCRLSYKRPENRTFFITLFKHINYTNRKGLRRTPLEYSKFLLSLDPLNDPLFATLLIDFYAIRSGEYDYLIEFITKWQHLAKLPNMNFSLPLAYFMKSLSKKQGKSVSESNLKLADDLLQKALIRYPNFIIPLLDSCLAEPSAELKKCDYFDYSVYSNKYKTVPESIDLLVAIYVQRNNGLWKTRNVLAWLERNVAYLVDQFLSKKLSDEGKQIEYWKNFQGPAPKNLLRHIVLSELKVKIPPSASNATVFDIDPFPPNSIYSYKMDRSDLSTVSSAASTTSQTTRDDIMSSLRVSGLFLRSLLPDYSSSGSDPHQTQSSSQSNHAQIESNLGNMVDNLNRQSRVTDQVHSPNIEHGTGHEDSNNTLNLNPIQSSILNVLTSLSSLLSGAENQAATSDESNGPSGNNQQQEPRDN